MKKIAILGGGMASLSAAYWLTSKPGWEQEYAITVYQLGWRLGGKAASGQNPGRWDRTEEHGYHMLFGFYENTFATMRGCYDALGRGPGEPLAEFCALTAADEQRYPQRYAVKRGSLLFLPQAYQGAFPIIEIDFPTNPFVPGDGAATDVWAALANMIGWLLRFATDPKYACPTANAPPVSSPETDERSAQIAASPAFRALDVPADALATPEGVLHTLQKALAALPATAREHRAEDLSGGYDLLADLVALYLVFVWLWIGRDIDTSWSAFRAWILQDFAGLNIIGFLRDRVVLNGFDALNGTNYYAWLMEHGVPGTGTNVTVGSVLGQFSYDACFAFRGGDTSSPPTPEKPLPGAPDMETGTMLRGMMRMLLVYKGAVDWLFQCGCGDALAAPMYQLLRRRGVRFEFFQKVLDLELSADKTAIHAVEMERQVTLNVGTYEPLTLVQGLPSWPSEPMYSQIVQGEELQRLHVDLESHWTAWKGEPYTMRAGVDFDVVLLGIAVGGLPGICGQLAAASPAWRAMLASVRTTRTFGFQTWLSKSEEDLGWTRGPVHGDTGVEPCSMQADATQVVARENWPARSTPKNMTYFGGAMADDPDQPPAPAPAYPPTQAAVVEGIAVDYLGKYSGIFWPKSVGATGFDWGLLVAPREPGVTGPARFRTQFWRANINPWERYTLSVVDSSQHRLTAGGSGFSNLILTGDWIQTPLNCGCMEATVMSGMQASQAICGYPTSVVGEDGFGGVEP